MNDLRHKRIADAIAAASPGRRRRLARTCRLSQREPEALLGPLSDPDDIRRRAARLDAMDTGTLDDLIAGQPYVVDDQETQDFAVLFDLGLAFEHTEDDGTLAYVPIEVIAALLDESRAGFTPLAAFLVRREEDDLAELAALHGVVDHADDPFAVALAIAEILTDPERAQSLFESLPAPARNALLWAVQHGAGFDASALRARAAELAARVGDATSSAERVLLRIGLMQPVPGDDERFALPVDVCDVLHPILDAGLADRCAERYDQLRDGAVQAFRDIFPRGAGGDTFGTFRARFLRALATEPDPYHPVDRLLVTLQILEPGDVDVGRLASFHLDVSGPEPLARQALRAWVVSLDDEFTARIVSAFGGSSEAIANAAHEADHDVLRGLAVDRWSRVLTDARGNLLIALGVLPAGHWFRLTDLAIWFVSCWRRVTWLHGNFFGVDATFPTGALPRCGVDVTSADEDAVGDALGHVMLALLGPLGAVDIDDSGTLFMVNPEALRVFRDGDRFFDTLWYEAGAYLGDDVDLWLPYPTDAGTRVSGTAGMRWRPDHGLVVERRAHVHDLVRLVQLADAEDDRITFVFHFTAESVGRAEEWGVDLDEFLVWLTVRTGARVPGPVRTLFPVSRSAADGEPHEVAAAATAQVAHEIDVLESWADQPPVGLMETLRGWGPAAVGPILDRLSAAVGEQAWDDHTLPHLAVLLGELGEPAAAPALLRTVAFSENPDLAGAAGVALARIGSPAIDSLVALLTNHAAPVEQRMRAASVLSSAAVLHPHLCDAVASQFSALLDDEDLEPEVATMLALDLAECGHPEAEAELYRLRDAGDWDDSVVHFEEALWIAGISPAVWGHPIYAAPIAMIYNAADRDDVRRWLSGEDDDADAPETDSDEALAIALGGDERRRRRPR